MELQIPQLRELFESRVGQIASVLADHPPAELGKIDPMMRGLKGFVFALEGMLRKNELQHMPFTARVELFDRVDQAIDALEALPDSFDRDQALDVLRMMDSLHRLCLQENLMASGLDASKLGRLTVILERKLGEVIETIDEVAETGQGQVGQIEQATQERLAQIQGTYKQQAEALTSSASVAVESIRAQAKTIQQQQAEAMERVDAHQGELRSKLQQCQVALDEQLTNAGSVVAEIRGEQQAVTDLLARAREQLDSTQATMRKIAETAEATEIAQDDLQAKLSEGRDVIGSIRDLLETGTQAAGELTAKLIVAQQGVARIQQTADDGATLSEQAAQEQAQSVAAMRESAAAAEKMLQDAHQGMAEQSEAAQGVLSEMQSHGKTVDDIVEQALRKQQSAEQAKAAAAESLRQAEEDLTQFRSLLAQGRQATEQLEELDRLAQTGEELAIRVAQTLDQTQQRIGQIEDEASQAASAIREGKNQALCAARDAVDEAERLQRQFTQTLSDQREAARNAVVALRSDQALGADLLGRTKQDMETLTAEISRMGELRSAAEDADGQVRQTLDHVGSVVTELKGILGASGAVKAQIDGHLAESSSARERMESMVRETALAAEDLRHQQDRALSAVRAEAEAAEAQRKTSETALDAQREAADSLVADLSARKECTAALLAEARQHRDAALTGAQATGEARVAAAQATGEVQASLLEARRAATDIAGLLAAGAESRAKIDIELTTATDASSQAGEIRRQLGEFFDHTHQQGQDMATAAEQSQQLITDLRSDGQQALAGLVQQNTKLTARSEALQLKLEDLFGAAADGGLYRQFDDLAQQSAPRRAQWLKRMIVSGAGGGMLLAVVSSILAFYSVWAAGAVLVAGLVPLGFFMTLCVAQYTAERRTESDHHYRATVSRSLAAYRKLLSTMQAEGIADSAYVDRMLSALFGAPTEPAPAVEAPKAKSPAGPEALAPTSSEVTEQGVSAAKRAKDHHAVG
jgi:hypothetical protein